MKKIKQLKFADHLVSEVLSGRKTVTWRLFDEKELSQGDRIELLTKKGEVFSRGAIVSVVEKQLGKIDDLDYDGHERFRSKDEMISTYQKYYGNCVNELSQVKIIRFKLEK